LVERGAHDLVFDGRRAFADHLAGEIAALALLEKLHRGLDGHFVAAQHARQAGPRFARGHEVLAFYFVQLGKLLLQRDFALRVRGAHRLLLDEGGELVPATAALEQAAQMLPRRGIAAIDGADLLPGLNGGFEIAQLRLAEPRHVEQLLLARLGGGVGCACRLHQHVAELGVLPLLAQVVFHPRQRFGVRGIGGEHAFVLGERLRLLPAGGEGRRFLQRAHHLFGAKLGPPLAYGVGFHCARKWAHRHRCVTRRIAAHVRRARLAPRIGSHCPPGIDLQVLLPARVKLIGTAELARIVAGELHRAIVAGRRVEGSGRVSEAVLARVHFRKRHEEIGRLLALAMRDGFTRLHALQDRCGQLLYEGGIVLRDVARFAQCLRCTGAIAEKLSDFRFVAIKGKLALDVGDDRLLHRKERERVGILFGLFVQLPQRVDGVGGCVVEFDGAAVIVRPFFRCGKGGLHPKPP